MMVRGFPGTPFICALIRPWCNRTDMNLSSFRLLALTACSERRFKVCWGRLGSKALACQFPAGPWWWMHLKACLYLTDNTSLLPQSSLCLPAIVPSIAAAQAEFGSPEDLPLHRSLPAWVDGNRETGPHSSPSLSPMARNITPRKRFIGFSFACSSSGRKISQKCSFVQRTTVSLSFLGIGYTYINSCWTCKVQLSNILHNLDFIPSFLFVSFYSGGRVLWFLFCCCSHGSHLALLGLSGPCLVGLARALPCRGCSLGPHAWTAPVPHPQPSQICGGVTQRLLRWARFCFKGESVKIQTKIMRNQGWDLSEVRVRMWVRLPTAGDSL